MAKRSFKPLTEVTALTEADEKVLERYRRRVKEIDGYDERLRVK